MKKMMTQKRRNGSKLDELQRIDSIPHIMNYNNNSQNQSSMFKTNMHKTNSKKTLAAKLQNIDKLNNNDYNEFQNIKNPFKNN